ncbi:MAG: cytochrome c, partial [Opitutaceae bacterium]
MKTIGAPLLTGSAMLVAAFLAGCGNMDHQDNVRPFAPSNHFANGASARPAPAHAVARGSPAPDDSAATGQKDGVPLAKIPLRLTRELLERGQVEFNAFCSACHGEDGYGNGIVV